MDGFLELEYGKNWEMAMTILQLTHFYFATGTRKRLSLSTHLFAEYREVETTCWRGGAQNKSVNCPTVYLRSDSIGQEGVWYCREWW